MKRRLISVLALLCSSACNFAWGGNQGAPGTPKPADKTYSVAALDSELLRLSDKLGNNPSHAEIGALRNSLPQSWVVWTPQRTYPISTKPLQDQLDGFAPVATARAWIEHLRVEIEASQAHGPNLGAARPELNHILGSPEFGAVHPPSGWEMFRQRVAAWAQQMLLRILGRMGRHPIGARILFWSLLIGGVAFVALWVFRFLTSRDSMESLKPGSTIATSRTWQEWIRAARQAANNGDFREAVHSAYWAGIVRLEDTGTVPRDRTRTPREYVALMAKSDSVGTGSQTNRREALMALTSRLERTWYANRSAQSQDFRDSLRQLQELGCPFE
jgi:hypothetical protein